MRNKCICKDIFKFDELSEDVQGKVLDNMREWDVYHEWWEFVYEDAKECGAIIGISVDNIYFSGFSSQGDGACFEGSYVYRKGSVKEIKKHAPQDEELHAIAEALYREQKQHGYKLEANIKHRGRYYHSSSNDITVYFDGFDTYSTDIEEALRRFMDWIYKRLEQEYKYLTSDEAVKETIEANEYEFTVDGDIW